MVFYRDGNVILAVPKKAGAGNTFGGKPLRVSLREYRGISLLTSRLNDVLTSLIPELPAIKRRPYRFLARKREFVSEILQQWPDAPRAALGFAIRPRYEIEARKIELSPGSLQIAVTVNISTQWQVPARLGDLVQAGCDVSGLYVIRRKPLPEERLLVGRIAGLTNGRVLLDESFDETKDADESVVQIEGSREAFKRCLAHILGSERYRLFEQRRETLESAFTTGPGYEEWLQNTSDMLQKRSPVTLFEGVTINIGDPIRVRNTESHKSWVRLPEVEYCFDAAKTRRHKWAWDGLKEFGPFDRDTFEKRSPRILLAAPQEHMVKVEQAVRSLLDGLKDEVYGQGMTRLFGLVNPKVECLSIPLGRTATHLVAKLYYQALETHLTGSPDYDVAIVVVPDQFARLPDSHNPYLFAKAVLLTCGIPVQEARVSTLVNIDQGSGYKFRSLAVALYAKMNGVPWTVSQNQTYHDELVIGLGVAEVMNSRVESRQRHVGITTVFRGDGNYLLSSLSKECDMADYPEVLKASTKTVLEEVKKRNGWQPKDRVRLVFHSSKPLKFVELDEILDECVREVASEQTVDFASLTVQRDHGFRILDKSQNGLPARRGATQLKGVYAPHRGTVVQIGDSTRLLAVNGISQIKRAETPLPAPLLIHLHKKSTCRSLDALAEQVLKFTSLTWRSTQPAEKPVTIYYSELIAGLLARLRVVPKWSPNMLNTRLRASKWFL